MPGKQRVVDHIARVGVDCVFGVGGANIEDLYDPAYFRLPRTELRPPRFEVAGVRYRDAMSALDRVLPDGVDIVVDAGSTGAADVHYLPVRRRRRYVVALGMGGIGYSFGVAIGMAFGRAMSARAKVRGPSGRVAVIAGDHAFLMQGMEVHTAVHYRLQVKFVLLNNNAHAVCVTHEQLFYDDLYRCNWSAPCRLGAGLLAIFPALTSLDVSEVDGFSAALKIDDPSGSGSNALPTKSRHSRRSSTTHQLKVFAIQQISITKENRTDVAARA